MIRHALAIALAVPGLVASGTTLQAGCGPDSGTCVIQDGEYQLALPDPAIANPPAVMFLHGAGGTGRNVMRNSRLVNAFLARGYAVLAPSAVRPFGNGNGKVWNFYPGWEGRDETGFLKRVIADATGAHGIDRDRVLLAGFSAGAFMVSYLACDAPDTFAAYAPVSGGFWQPHPEACAGPVKLFQTQGWRDRTVPIEGRSLGGGRFQQGDIFTGLQIWRAANECADQRPDGFSETGQFWRRNWTSSCAEGSALEMALFPGGHGVPEGWAGMVLDWFEAVSAG